MCWKRNIQNFLPCVWRRDLFPVFPASNAFPRSRNWIFEIRTMRSIERHTIFLENRKITGCQKTLAAFYKNFRFSPIFREICMLFDRSHSSDLKTLVAWPRKRARSWENLKLNLQIWPLGKSGFFGYWGTFRFGKLDIFH